MHHFLIPHNNADIMLILQVKKLKFGEVKYLPKITQLANGRTGFKLRKAGFRILVFKHYTYYIIAKLLNLFS